MSYWKAGHIIQRGKYVIEKVLGAGGAGITYRAKGTKTGEIVAIKTLNATIQAQSDFSKHQERFIQEAFRLAKCSHSHVIRVDDVCQEGELWCMIMEYVQGGDLDFLVRKNKGLSEGEAAKYIIQIGSALAYIHEQGILHRDVKPANIMRRIDSDEAVLIDFGLARDFIEDKTQIHTNSRTEGFAPLEQYVRSAKRGAYTDVYALAATLYYVLTMQIPFPAQFRNQGINLIPPKQHNPQISDQINFAILKGMELKPENRPQSINEWLSLLLGKTQISTSDISIPENNQQIVTPSAETPEISTPPHTKKTHNPIISSPPPPPPLRTNTRPKKIIRRVRRTKSNNIPKYDPLDPSRFIQQNTQPETQDNLYNQPEQSTQHQQETSLPKEEIPNTSEEKSSSINPPSLPSAVGIDYQPLKKLLMEGKWQEADHKTNLLMLQAIGEDDFGSIDKNAMKNFPCEDLHTIDQIWVKYSRGQFGFSIQKIIYQSLGGKRVFDKKIWEALGDKIGWRVNKSWLFQDDLNYSLTAPKGHLPSLANSGLLDRGIYTLISRGMDCNL